MNYPFLKEEQFGLRTQFTFTGNSCKIYVPEAYFNKAKPEIAFAREMGNTMECLGIFWFVVDGKTYSMYCPVFIQFEFSDQKTERTKIKPEMQIGTYHVFTLKNGDAFIFDALHKKDVTDIQKNFIGKFVEGARLDNANIPYRDLLPIFIDAMTVTEFTSLGIPGVLIEILLSEESRLKSNINIPFRQRYTGSNDFDYKLVKINKLSGLNSTFTSLIGEDTTNQVVSAILRNRENATEIISPIEKYIKY